MWSKILSKFFLVIIKSLLYHYFDLNPYHNLIIRSPEGLRIWAARRYSYLVEVVVPRPLENCTFRCLHQTCQPVEWRPSNCTRVADRGKWCFLGSLRTMELNCNPVSVGKNRVAWIKGRQDPRELAQQR